MNIGSQYGDLYNCLYNSIQFNSKMCYSYDPKHLKKLTIQNLDVFIQISNGLQQNGNKFSQISNDPLEIQALCKPTPFRPFRIWISPDF